LLNLVLAPANCNFINDDGPSVTQEVTHQQHWIPVVHQQQFVKQASHITEICRDLAKKDPQEAEVALSSESDSDSYYSDRFDSVSARDPTPPNAHVETSTAQSVHSTIEEYYKTPVFHVEHEEVQHPRYVNPRRVGKKKPLDPRPRQQTPTKAKRNEERRVESKIPKQRASLRGDSQNISMN
jgi:hypothetical protein